MTNEDSGGDHVDGDDDLKAADEALASARRMPRGPERILALKQAGQMRYDAEQRLRKKGANLDRHHDASRKPVRD